jgi:hypothetical protein
MSRTSLSRLLIFVGVMLSGVLPAAALAESVTAQSGNEKATFTYYKNPDPASNQEPPYSNEALTVERLGQILFEGSPTGPVCSSQYPCWVVDTTPLRVVDLDGDREPEILLSLFTGGAHCCSVVQVLHYDASANSYSTISQNFGDAGFAMQTLRRKLVFRSADARFDYRYTGNAYSGLPLQFWKYTSSGFQDITKSFPAPIRKDAKSWWHQYQALRHQATGYELGFLAAWAADEYRLGRANQASRILESQANQGLLRGPGLHGHAFVRNLRHVLRSLGY